MNILDRIVADTRTLLATRQRTVSRAELEDRALFHEPRRAFGNALQGRGPHIIAEIKKASPSKGVLRDDFSIETLAQQYQTGGAAALSILTEPHHFQGDLQNLTFARNTVSLPLLRKDFIVDPYQLVEARAYGADAVLLIAKILSASQLADLHTEAEALGLACLVEAYHAEDLAKMDFDQVKIVGINNRDLTTFTVNRDHAATLFETVPDHVIRIAESGLRTAADLAYLQARNIHAFLIGETLMRAPDPAQMLRTLRGETVPTS